MPRWCELPRWLANEKHIEFRSRVGRGGAERHGCFAEPRSARLVREWTANWYEPRHQADPAKAFCIRPHGGREEVSHDPCRAENSYPAQGRERRFASVR